MDDASERSKGTPADRDLENALDSIDRYLDRLYRRGRKQTTIDNYRYVLVTLVRFLSEKGLHTMPDAIGETEISAIIHDYPGVSDLTRKDYVTKLSRWMSVEADNRAVERMDLLWPKSERPGRIWADREDAMKILRNENVTNRLIIGLAMELGLRACEISSLKVSDVKGNWIRVYGKGHGDGKMRELYIMPDLRWLIDDYLAHRDSIAKPDEDRMILSNSGSPISAHSVTKRVMDMGKRNDVKMTAHSLRRTFLTDMLDSGVNLTTVSEIAGHENPSITARYYKCKKDRVRDAMECRHEHITIPIE